MPASGRPEQPGTLQVFGYDDGRLAARGEIAPHGGYGFGPRHLDFHPDLPWMFLGLERQNEILVFGLDGDTVDTDPVFRVSTLAGPGRGPPGDRGHSMSIPTGAGCRSRTGVTGPSPVPRAR